MSIHINAKKDEIAPLVLLPGDPLRAKFIAENFLEDAQCYNTVRNMYGFTGTYNGTRVSVQGTGMGIPSISIYVNELYNDYGVQKAVRIGTAGSIQKDVKLRDLVLAVSASTDSAANTHRFGGRTFAPSAGFSLLHAAFHAAEKLTAANAAEGAASVRIHAGAVFTSDMFYNDVPDVWKLWARYGILAVEMETAELYTLAAKYGREALALLTISDSLVSGESTSSAEREISFRLMMQTALEAITTP
ncbi:MAG: purine-nucleoside phosphorylase [Spirochaetaceae bacterium]|jgi:purine-nucleoside phosphorylase|nr:purine-nucleoside phosphorylase [Spirochaetaceae bacterium]